MMTTLMLSSGWLRCRAQRLFGGLWFAAITLLTADCSVIVDAGREQCASNGDCQKRGGAFARSLCQNEVCVTDPVWGCVGSVTWPSPPPVPSPEKVTVKVALSNLLTKMVAPGVAARVCGRLDAKCDTPLQTDLKSDDDGVLSLQLDKFFDGFLELKYPSMVDTMYFFNPPVDKDRNIPFIPLVPFDAFAVFAEQLKMMPILDRGTVIGLSYDCQGNGAAGLQLTTDESDDKTVGFYMVNGYPSIEATKTDTSGQGGIANVFPGVREVAGRLVDTGELIGTVNVLVRPLWISYTSMLPTPLSSKK